MKPNNHSASADKIQKLIADLKIEPSTELDARVNSAIDDALAQRKRIYKPNIGRLIMKSPITKLAAAAVIIITVLAGIYLITGKTPSVTCCAWAQIADRVAQIKTCVCRVHIRQSGGNIGQKGQEVESKMYISSDYGYKMETTLDGNTVQRM